MIIEVFKSGSEKENYSRQTKVRYVTTKLCKLEAIDTFSITCRLRGTGGVTTIGIVLSDAIEAVTAVGGTVSSDKEKVKEAVPPTAVTASIASESTIPIVVTPPVPLSLQVIDNASMNFNLHKLVVTYLTLVCLG